MKGAPRQGRIWARQSSAHVKNTPRTRKNSGKRGLRRTEGSEVNRRSNQTPSSITRLPRRARADSVRGGAQTTLHFLCLPERWERKEGFMQVIAFSTPSYPDWRWRIVNYAGEVVEESHETFPSIALAV